MVYEYKQLESERYGQDLSDLLGNVDVIRKTYKFWFVWEDTISAIVILINRGAILYSTKENIGREEFELISLPTSTYQKSILIL